VPIVLKSGSLNLLEALGPVQACNGIALPFMKNFEWKEIPMLSVADSFYWRHLFYCVQVLLDADNGSLQQLW